MRSVLLRRLGSQVLSLKHVNCTVDSNGFRQPVPCCSSLGCWLLSSLAAAWLVWSSPGGRVVADIFPAHQNSNAAGILPFFSFSKEPWSSGSLQASFHYMPHAPHHCQQFQTHQYPTYWRPILKLTNFEQRQMWQRVYISPLLFRMGCHCPWLEVYRPVEEQYCVKKSNAFRIV